MQHAHLVCRAHSRLPAAPRSLQLRLPVCLKLHTAVLAGHGVCGELALPPSLHSLVLLNVMRDARSLRLADMVGARGAEWGGLLLCAPQQRCHISTSDTRPQSWHAAAPVPRPSRPPLIRAALSPSRPCCPTSPQVPRLKTAVLGMGWLPTSLPPTVERLAVVGEPAPEALAQACSGLEVRDTCRPQLAGSRLCATPPHPHPHPPKPRTANSCTGQRTLLACLLEQGSRSRGAPGRLGPNGAAQGAWGVRRLSAVAPRLQRTRPNLRALHSMPCPAAPAAPTAAPQGAAADQRGGGPAAGGGCGPAPRLPVQHSKHAA